MTANRIVHMKKNLVFAPHADDEILGMGGTIARFIAEGQRVVVAVITGHGEEKHPIWPRENWDIIRKECIAATKIIGVNEVIFRELPAACLDATPAWKINSVINEILINIDPDEIYVPFSFDLHKDHGAVAYALSVAARPYLTTARSVKRVLAYETLSETHMAPSYLATSFQPNVYINITDTIEKKIDAMCAYVSQLQPDHQPRSIAGLRALATFRGTHIGCPAAEAFVLLGEYTR